MKRENYPVDIKSRRLSPAEEIPFMQPGHTITFVAPVIIENLLPIDMTYYLKNLNIKGSVKPGREAPLYVVSVYSFWIYSWQQKPSLTPLEKFPSWIIKVIKIIHSLGSKALSNLIAKLHSIWLLCIIS